MKRFTIKRLDRRTHNAPTPELMGRIENDLRVLAFRAAAANDTTALQGLRQFNSFLAQANKALGARVTA